MKVKVIEENCIGCGACQSICPEVFEVDGVSQVIKSEITDAEEKEAVVDAIESCPTSAIEEIKE